MLNGFRMEQRDMTTTARVLIVDDNADICDVIAAYLEIVGCTVDKVYGPDAAIHLFESRPYDVVLVDKNMQSISSGDEGGMDVLRHVRSRDKSVILIMMTGHATGASFQEAMRLKVDDYIHKPFAMDDLLQRIQYLLNTRSPGPGGIGKTP